MADATRDVTVEELRAHADWPGTLRDPARAAFRSAADQLETLAAQVERLTAERDRLRETSELNYRKGNEHHERAIALAAERDALRAGLLHLQKTLAIHQRGKGGAPWLTYDDVDLIDALLAKPAWQPTHRHYKGGLYEAVAVGWHSETEEQLQIYRGENGRIWVRPYAMFHDTLPDGRKRFDALAKPEGQ